MNPDPLNPRQAIECSLTALLLGELPPDQAAALQALIAHDLELAKIHDRLKNAMELVRETETSPVPEPASQPTPLKLSDSRRQALLQKFKTVAPKEFSKPVRRQRRTSWLVPVAALLLISATLAAMLLPALSKAKSKAMRISGRSLSFGTWALDDRSAPASPRVFDQTTPPPPPPGDPTAVLQYRLTPGQPLPAAPAAVAARSPSPIVLPVSEAASPPAAKYPVETPDRGLFDDARTITASTAGGTHMAFAGATGGGGAGFEPATRTSGTTGLPWSTHTKQGEIALANSGQPEIRVSRLREALHNSASAEADRESLSAPPALEPEAAFRRRYGSGAGLGAAAAGDRSGKQAAPFTPDTGDSFSPSAAPPASLPMAISGTSDAEMNAKAKLAEAGQDKNAATFDWYLGGQLRTKGQGQQGTAQAEPPSPAPVSHPSPKSEEAPGKIPALGDLPVVGKLFQGESRDSDRKARELAAGEPNAIEGKDIVNAGAFKITNSLRLNDSDAGQFQAALETSKSALAQASADETVTLGYRLRNSEARNFMPNDQIGGANPGIVLPTATAPPTAEALPAPGFRGIPPPANPQGFFPGTSLAKATPSAGSDQLLTAGLRNAIPGIRTEPTGQEQTHPQEAAVNESVRRQAERIQARQDAKEIAARDALTEQEAKVREAQKKVDDLRSELTIPDSATSKNAPTMLLTAETLRRIGNLPTENKAEYLRQLGQGLPNLQTEVDSAMRADQTKATLSAPYWEAKRELEVAKREAEVSQTRKEVDALRKQVRTPNTTVTEIAPAEVAESTLPNTTAHAATDLTVGGKGRQEVFNKLDRIAIPSTGWDGLPLSEVVKRLNEESRKRDPEHHGINFVLNENAGGGIPGATDPATGLPIATTAPAKDISSIPIRITPTLTDVRLADVVDAIVKVADKPIEYSIEDHTVTFSPKVQNAPLYTRVIKVDPNTFKQGLQSVTGFDFGGIAQGGQTSGGTTGGGSLRVPRVVVAGNSAAGQGLGAGTRTNSTFAQAAVRQFFLTIGIDLNSVFFNDRDGSLTVRGTAKDLERVEQAIQVLNIAPPPVENKYEPDAGKKPVATAETPVPQPEVQTRDNAFSTFSLNVSDVSFKLAAASLEKGVLPDPASIRSEEFINAFDYRDPEPAPGAPIAFAWERARYPFAQNRDLLRFSLKTAAQGRQPGRPLNIVLLLDNSGSMERADRVRIIQEALRVLATQLQAQDIFSVVTFARTARLWVDGVPGNQAGQVAEEVGGLTPQGGTNLEEAMNLAYATALRHYQANGINRVVLLTDGAANLGEVEPEPLKKKVEDYRKQGIALDGFGIGWEGYNDDLLEVLTRNGDGRYGFINTPEEAATEFAGQLAGALQVAASDVKVQVEFNPQRVSAYRQVGYAKHQLTKEQFRDNTVDAAEIGAAESGNALYVVEVNPAGSGPLGTVRVRYKIPGTTEYREQEWAVPYNGSASALVESGPALRLAGTAAAFAEWLAGSPFAAEVTPDTLLGTLSGVPPVYGADARPGKLEWMLRQAKSLAGK